MFEQRKSSNPIEELVKSAASGDLGRVEEVVRERMVAIDDQFNGHTALQAASQNGHMDVVRCLLRHGANTEEEDKDRDRAVHHASFGNKPDIIDLLVWHGVDLNARNRRKQTSLHMAVNKGHDFEGDTPLHDAISKMSGRAPAGGRDRHHYSQQQWIQLPPPRSAEGASPDVQNINQQTPLHLAVERRNIQIVRLLVEEEANSDIGDKFRDRPLHEALRRHTMSQLKQLKESNQDIGKAMVTASSEKSSASIAIFLCSTGGSLQCAGKEQE